MKKTLMLIGGLAVLLLPLKAQEESNEDYPVRSVFETTTLIDNATTVSLYKGMMQMEIQHRFGNKGTERFVRDIRDGKHPHGHELWYYRQNHGGIRYHPELQAAGPGMEVGFASADRIGEGARFRELLREYGA